MTGFAPLAARAADLLAAVRRKRPRVHCLTNTVVQKFTADGLSALGVIPTMTSNLEEIGAFVGRADAMLVNLGTLDRDRRAVIETATSLAGERRLPWLLDPVHCELSPSRLAFAHSILAKGPAVTRGNTAEIAALAPSTGTVVETGEIDRLRSGSARLAILNGHPWMAQVTGTGCLSGAVIASFLAVSADAFEAAAAAVLLMGVSAEVAAAKSGGPGTLAPNLLDALATIEPSTLASMARLSDA
jgi:hydroxyethylthiazole kinase